MSDTKQQTAGGTDDEAAAVTAGATEPAAERERSEAPSGDEEAGVVKAADAKKPGKMQQLVAEYGAIGLIVFLSISVVTYTILVIAISAGFEPEGAGEEGGVWLAAYIVLQATKPIRIPLTIVLTPIVAAMWHRVRGRTPPTKGSPTDAS